MTTQSSLQYSFTFTQSHTHSYSAPISSTLLFYEAQFRVQHLAQGHHLADGEDWGSNCRPSSRRTTALPLSHSHLKEDMITLLHGQRSSSSCPHVVNVTYQTRPFGISLYLPQTFTWSQEWPDYKFEVKGQGHCDLKIQFFASWLDLVATLCTPATPKCFVDSKTSPTPPLA